MRTKHLAAGGGKEEEAQVGAGLERSAVPDVVRSIQRRVFYSAGQRGPGNPTCGLPGPGQLLQSDFRIHRAKMWKGDQRSQRLGESIQPREKGGEAHIHG